MELTRQIWELMSPADQARYQDRFGQSTPGNADLASDPHPPPKRGGPEKKEQSSFANWVLLQNSKRSSLEQIPFVWHATNSRSKATPGTPDFWVGINGHSLWFEFKRDYSCQLSEEQEKFRLACHCQRQEHFVVYSAEEAIKRVQEADARGW